jgi:glycosyltransferase involved in cell wall biosynthesis
MDKSNCLVSILCTAYNHEEYIRTALDGFVSQTTDFGFEILVNDDASTDGTAAVIREYEKQYPELIRPFYQTENQFSKGIGYIYENIFFPNARGKYVAFCEGDDYWTEPTKLQQQVDFLESHPDYSACVHNTMLHYCNGGKEDELLIAPMGDHDVPFENIIKGPNGSYHTSSILARKEIICQRPDYYLAATSHGFADYAWALLLRLNGSIRFIDKCMSVYRLNSNPSAWSSGVDGQYKKLRGFVEGKCQMLKAFLPYAPEEYKSVVQDELLEREFELMYIEGRDREQRREPYRRILKKQSRSYQVKNFIKSYVPGVQKLYRKKQGYVD